MISRGHLRVVLAVTLAACGVSSCLAGSQARPVKRDGGKWRIGYYEAGPYINYTSHLRAFANALAELGWMEPVEIPESPEPGDTGPMWRWLCENVKSDYVEFLPSAYWSHGWNEGTRAEARPLVIERLRTQGDIDLMIAMGTWAGEDLATNDHSVPTLIMSSSDPIRAGIVDGAEDSGYDHVHARCDPDRYTRQVRLFHRIVRFKRLGVVYEDSPLGGTYVGLEDLRRVAAERGFELVERHARETGLTDEESMATALETYTALAPEIDALWIGAHRGEAPQFMPRVLKPMFDHCVPTWASQGSSVQVKRGVLLSTGNPDMREVGLFHARAAARIFNGELPRSIGQISGVHRSLTMNRATARRIGFELPPGLEYVADTVFDEIEGLDF